MGHAISSSDIVASVSAIISEIDSKPVSGSVSSALMDAVLERARTREAASVWLGVNQRNERAQRFYAKHGFAVASAKTFRLGGHWEQDYVMVRPA